MWRPGCVRFRSLVGNPPPFPGPTLLGTCPRSLALRLEVCLGGSVCCPYLVFDKPSALYSSLRPSHRPHQKERAGRLEGAHLTAESQGTKQGCEHHQCAGQETLVSPALRDVPSPPFSQCSQVRWLTEFSPGWSSVGFSVHSLSSSVGDSSPAS